MTQIQLVKSTWEILGLFRYLIFSLFVYFFSVICLQIICLLSLEWKKLNIFLLILIRMRLKLKPERKNQPWVYFQIMFNRYVKKFIEIFCTMKQNLLLHFQGPTYLIFPSKNDKEQWLYHLTVVSGGDPKAGTGLFTFFQLFVYFLVFLFTNF